MNLCRDAFMTLLIANRIHKTRKTNTKNVLNPDEWRKSRILLQREPEKHETPAEKKNSN